MNRYRELGEHAAAEIATLADDGITLEPAEVVKLNGLCWDVESPNMDLHLARGTPIRVGNVWLWPQTLRAGVWYQDVGSNLGTHKLRRLAMAYSMAHAYSDGFDRLWDLDCAAAAVRAWQKTIKCRMEALEVAMAQVFDQDPDPERPPRDNEGRKLSPGEYACIIASFTDRPIAEIEAGMSIRFAGALLDQLMQQARAAGKEMPCQKERNALGAKGRYIQELRDKYAPKDAE